MTTRYWRREPSSKWGLFSLASHADEVLDVSLGVFDRVLKSRAPFLYFRQSSGNYRFVTLAVKYRKKTESEDHGGKHSFTFVLREA